MRADPSACFNSGREAVALRFVFCSACLSLALAAGPTPAGAEKDPAVPPGTDPGGVAVAVIETGVDYTLPHIAEHLARDGEGELIGWDFVDGDRHPFKERDDLEEADYAHRGTAMARTLIKRAPKARLEVVRIDTSDGEAVKKSLAFIAQTPAKLAVLSLKSSTAALWAALREGMEALQPRFLLIVAAGEDEGDRDRIKEHLAPRLDSLDNVIVVTACDHAGHELTTAEGAATNADIAVNAEAFSGELLTADTFSFKPEPSIAAAEVAGLAARLLAQDKTIKPNEMRSVILGLAKPFPGGHSGLAKSGFIADPWRHFSDP
jgi:hypothetical protein